MRSITGQARRFVPVILLILAAGIALGQTKPNFSGTWKVNLSKSDFGPIPAPDSHVEKISHEDPNMKVNVAQSGQMGEMNFDLTYTTDGKECTNTVAGNEFKSVLNWDGSILVIETKGSFDGNDFTAKDRWSLSDDGKTRTVERHLASAMGEADQKIIFDKE